MYVRSRESQELERVSIHELVYIHMARSACYGGLRGIISLQYYTVLLIPSQFICNHRDTCIDTMELYYTHMHPWDSIFPGKHMRCSYFKDTLFCTPGTIDL